MNLKNLQKMIDEGYIGKQVCPDRLLTIYNYTAKAQYERVWNDETLMCRGLILGENNEVVARPFKKFFNLEEVDGILPEGNFEITQKLDGSLGILYHTETPRIATRGSFTSEQAVHATKVLNTRYAHVKFDPSITYLFEIIYPENRIVVNYGEKDDLILLAMIETDTGRDLPLQEIGIPLVKRYDGIKDFRELTKENKDNEEGYVVKFQNGFRVKMKFPEYVRLHKLVTQVNAKVIWEMLRDGKPTKELLEKVPDEFYTWVKNTIGDLMGKKLAIKTECEMLFRDLGDRKANAMFYQTTKYPSILFCMLDGKDYDQHIWKLIKPKAEKPFKQEI